MGAVRQQQMVAHNARRWQVPHATRSHQAVRPPPPATHLSSVILGGFILMSVVSGAGAGNTDPDATRYTLRQAMATAFQNSPTVLDAQLSLRIADQQVREAWSAVLPRLSTNASYSRSVIKQSFFFGDTLITIGADNLWGSGITLSQPLFHMGAFIGVGAADQVRELQTERLRGTIQQVITQVRQAYLNALLAKEQVQLTEQSLIRVRQSLDEARALRRTGLASDYDVLRLEVQVSNLEAEFHRAQTSQDAARRDLLVQLGLPPDRNVSLAGSLNDLNIEAPEGNTADNQLLLRQIGFSDQQEQGAPVYERVLRGHSLLRQLHITTGLERARLAAQRAEYFPTVSIFLNYNLSAQQDGSLKFFGENANQRSDFAVAGLNIEVPIFTGFTRGARMQQRRAALRQSELRRRQQELQLESQVQTLLSNLADAKYRARSRNRALEQARRGYEIATAEFRSGVGSQLQISDAELALRQAEFNYSRSVYDYLSVRTQLDISTGAVPISLAELDSAPLPNN